MRGSNLVRLVLCGLVAGVVWHLVSIVCLSLFTPDFVASVQSSAPYPPRGGEFFYAIDLGMGIWAVWLYSAIDQRYRAQPITAAAIVGAAWWTLKTLQSAKWAGLGFVELGPELLLLGVATLAAAILSSAAGAMLYDKVSAKT